MRGEEAFKRLESNYEGHIADIFLYNFALSSNSGSIEFNESGDLLKNGDIGLVSTFYENEMDRFKEVVDYKKIYVNAITWHEFISLCPIKNFDFISMDIEGSELSVLPFMNLENCKMICIEWNSKPELKIEYEKYLSGFNLIHSNAENLIYAR